MEEKTFSIRVNGLEHHNWQGVLRTEGRDLPFHSELELLMTMDHLLREEMARDMGNAPEEGISRPHGCGGGSLFLLIFWQEGGRTNRPAFFGAN